MNTDIRLKTSFKGHRKRKRLTRILGLGATDYLIDLWITAAEDRPDGVLTGWTEVDISDAAGWPEKRPPEKLVNALIESGLLEKIDDVYVLHDWKIHQPWASGAEKRSEAASKAAKARWDKISPENESIDINNDADSCAPHKSAMPSAKRNAQKGNADSNAPSPSPLPSPILTVPNSISETNNSSNEDDQIEDPEWLLLIQEQYDFKPDHKWINMINRAWSDIDIEKLVECNFLPYWSGNSLSDIKSALLDTLEHARNNGEYKNNSNPDKYTKGKYGGVVQR